MGDAFEDMRDQLTAERDAARAQCAEAVREGNEARAALAEISELVGAGGDGTPFGRVESMLSASHAALAAETEKREAAERAVDTLREALEAVASTAAHSDIRNMAKVGLDLAADIDGNRSFYKEAHARAIEWGRNQERATIDTRIAAARAEGAQAMRKSVDAGCPMNDTCAAWTGRDLMCPECPRGIGDTVEDVLAGLGGAPAQPSEWMTLEEAAREYVAARWALSLAELANGDENKSAAAREAFAYANLHNIVNGARVDRAAGRAAQPSEAKAREWLLAALNIAWLHGCRFGKVIGRQNARTPEKPGEPEGRGDMTAILAECEARLGPWDAEPSVSLPEVGEGDPAIDPDAALGERDACIRDLIAAVEREGAPNVVRQYVAELACYLSTPTPESIDRAPAKAAHAGQPAQPSAFHVVGDVTPEEAGALERIAAAAYGPLTGRADPPRTRPRAAVLAAETQPAPREEWGTDDEPLDASRSAPNYPRADIKCTCTSQNTAYLGNPHGHAVDCPAWGSATPNRTAPLASGLPAPRELPARFDTLDESDDHLGGAFVHPMTADASGLPAAPDEPRVGDVWGHPRVSGEWTVDAIRGDGVREPRGVHFKGGSSTHLPADLSRAGWRLVRRGEGAP